MTKMYNVQATILMKYMYISGCIYSVKVHIPLHQTWNSDILALAIIIYF